jgi:hypothetical protein
LWGRGNGRWNREKLSIGKSPGEIRNLAVALPRLGVERLNPPASFAAQSALLVRDAHCCLAIYNASGRDSYSVVDAIVNRYEGVCVCSIPFIVVVRNKIDLEAAQNQIHVRSFLTSAKAGEGVREIFDFIAHVLILRGNLEDAPDAKGGPLYGPEKTEGGCC